MTYFVYILECADGTYYAGITNDLEKRIAAHNTSRLGAKYTRGRRPVKLIYSEEFATKSEALKREIEIKSLDRPTKENLTRYPDTRYSRHPELVSGSRNINNEQKEKYISPSASDPVGTTLNDKGDKSFEYTIRPHARARHLRITVYPDQRVVVTVPPHFSESKLNDFLQDKAAWVAKQLSVYKKAQPAGRNFDDKKSYAAYKESAMRLAERKVLEFNSYYKFFYKKIRITNAKTQWGSCSVDGVLSFNYRIAFLESRLVDYLVVHELCHLQHFNHSGRFWRLVSETIPDYIQARKDMRKEGLSLY